MASERFQFHYVKTPVGTISGQAVLTQTEDAINELGQYMYDATTDATDALNKATEALATANTAQTNAAAAVATANSALDSVNSLTVIVNSWEASVQEAVTDASQAVQTANAASENASQAVTTANAANNTANTALSNSQSAISTANNANQLATEAKSTAQEALATAEEAVRDTASDLAQVQTLVQTATDQANAASSSASAAATSAQAADNSANLAQDWAVKMDGMVTDDGTEEGTPVDYSSKYYAQQAAASASAASDSEDAAASSASAAASSQQAAATSAGQASTSATNAAGSATAAKGSATAAQNAQTAAEAARDLAQQYASANAHAVVYDPQTLTAEQQQQARTNIGAISADQVPDPDLTPYLTKADAQTMYLALDGSVVHKTGTETIDGSKTFQDSIFVSANPLIQSTNWSGIGIADTTRSATSSKLLCQLLDKDGKCFAGLEATAINDGRRSFQIIGRNRADTGWVNFIKFFEHTDGYVYATLPNSPDSTASNNTVATVGFVMSQLSTSIPAGAIMYFAQSNVPDGWLFCNGSSVSRTTYANLFAAIGTKYGSGNGSTTFTLPNLRDIFIQGASSTSNVGQSVAAGLPNITGSFVSVYGGNSVSGAFTSTGSGHTKNGTDRDGQAISFSASTSSGIYGASTTVQPPAIRLLPCIKA